jgi:hypothetical protein
MIKHFWRGGNPSGEAGDDGIPMGVSVALCSASSRTLRAGFAGAASGLLDHACAQHSGRRQVGTQGWSLRSNTGMFCGSGRLLLGTTRVKHGLLVEHRASHREQPVGNAAEGAPVAVTALAQFGIAAAAERIVLDSNPGPVIDRAAQSHMAGLAHDNDAALAATLGHRGDPGEGSQGVIISPSQGLCCLSEERGEDNPSDTRQGSQDRHVALLGLLS